MKKLKVGVLTAIIPLLFVFTGCATDQKHFKPAHVDSIHHDRQFYFKEMIDILATGACIEKVTK
ncbi:MAG: hypothetical protein M0P57_06130 [Syntrophales bacterium]|nr:hypothetical protein [Syntrophales bacterium]